MYDDTAAVSAIPEKGNEEDIFRVSFFTMFSYVAQFSANVFLLTRENFSNINVAMKINIILKYVVIRFELKIVLLTQFSFPWK